MGGTLATPKTPRQLIGLMFASITSYTWIGLDDKSNEGVFVWIDGSDLEWANWGSGEPNDYGSGEDCAHVTTDGIWNDNVCSSQFAYACQVPVDALVASDGP